MAHDTSDMELERSSISICAVRGEHEQQDASEECLNAETRSRGETSTPAGDQQSGDAQGQGREDVQTTSMSNNYMKN